MFQVRFRYVYMLLLGGYSYLNSYFSEVYIHYPIRAEWYWVLLAFVLVSAGVWEANRITGQFLGRRREKDKKTIHPLLLFFLVGTAFSVLVSAVVLLLIGKGFAKISDEEMILSLKLGVTFGTRINLFLHSINAIFFFLKEYRKKELEMEELKRISAQAELQAVRNQINPHFLFNNLNVLSSLVMSDHQDSNRFIEAFSRVYRHILTNQDKEMIPLSEERDFMVPYIFLLQKRFDAGLMVENHIPETYYSWLIIPVSLQMLVENAIKHNIVSRNKPLKISFSVNGNHCLVVSNNLQPKTSMEPSTQTGLANISKRYELATHRTIQVEQTSDAFSVALPLIPPDHHENPDY